MPEHLEKHTQPKRRSLNWNFVWISVLASLVITVPVSYIIFGEIRKDLIVLGVFIPLVVSPAMIYMSHRYRRRFDLEFEKYREMLETQVDVRTEELRESVKNYRAIFEYSPVGIVICNEQGRLLQVNPAFARMLGYEVDEMPETFGNITHSDDMQESMTLFKETVAGTRDGFSIRKRYMRRDGNVLWGNLHVRVVRDEAGAFMYSLAMIEDITERLKLEREMLRSRNLESLGALAGGIAHDFNNMLAVMLNNVSVARNMLEPQTPAYGKLLGVEGKFVHARDLTRQLMTFADGGAPLRQTTSVGSLLEDTVRFGLSGSGVRVSFGIPSSLWSAKIDAAQISQVINNIVLNAIDAMQGSGMLNVSVENVEIKSGDSLLLRPGDYVRLEISDSGPGIPEDVLPRIFDPYYTTKSHGTGLGLAISYSIVKRHEGYIQADSPPDGGACFTIFLPATLEEEMCNDEPEYTTGRLKVLVMDDEQGMRESTAEVLSILGHEVDVANDGQEAVDAFAQALGSDARFDVVILDLTVPGGMGGKEAATRIRGLDGRVKIVLSSGYSNSLTLSEYGKYGFDGALIKPYRLEELKRVLCTVSGGAKG